MDTVIAIIVPAFFTALAGGLTAYFTYKGVKAKAEVEAEADAKKREEEAKARELEQARAWALERQRLINETKVTDIEAAKGMAKAAQEYAQAAQQRVNELEAERDEDRARIHKLEDDLDAVRRELAAERQERHRVEEVLAAVQAEVEAWRKKFIALCDWVRAEAPEANINGFLAQLEAGPGG